jgi:hypothetical protein
MQSEAPRHGLIARVNPAGLCYVEDSESRQIFAFKFDRIEGYVGQTAAELGLKAGTPVAFTTGSDQLVQSVELEVQAA